MKLIQGYFVQVLGINFESNHEQSIPGYGAFDESGHRDTKR
jgi:hypothetical protein